MTEAEEGTEEAIEAGIETEIGGQIGESYRVASCCGVKCRFFVPNSL